MKIPRHDAIKRNTYFTVAVLLFSRWETACVKPNAILRRERMVTILLERREFIRATHYTSADLFLRCSLAIVVGSKLWASLVDNLLPLTALLLKGQSDCGIPAAKIWPPTRTPVRDCIRPYFSFPASRGPFFFVFAELTGGTKRDLCHGSKLPLIQPPSMVVDGGFRNACSLYCLLTATWAHCISRIPFRYFAVI